MNGSIVLNKLLRRLAAMAGLVLLVSCGGAEQVEPFMPTRLIVFGDEQSLLEADGTKYTVNFLNTTTNLRECGAYATWVQQVAAVYGMSFQGCLPAGQTAPVGGIMRATFGAKVADVAAQLDTHFATDTFGPQDLVTVYAGLHDIREAYDGFAAGTLTAPQAIALVDARGRALGAQINRVAEADGRVLFVTVQDMSLTPFAKAQNAAFPGTGRRELLRDLTVRFNLSVKLSVIKDGRLIGLVDFANATQIIARSPAFNGFTNVEDAVCDPVPLNTCDNSTLVDNGNPLTFLWADEMRISAGAQIQLADIGLARARGNPF